MHAIVNEIEATLGAGFYYVSIAMALSLPDMCAALESADGQTTGPKYRAWYNTWLAAKFNNITAEDMYRLRCGVVHQGRFGHPRMQYSRIIFTLPGPNHFHNNIFDDALNLDARTFCLDILSVVKAWYDAHAADQIVAENSSKLLQYRPNGLLPYMFGVAVIA